MKILVPVDFRNTSFSAFCYASILAEKVGGSITLLYVINTMSKLNELLDEEMLMILKNNSKQRLHHFATELPAIKKIELPDIEIEYDVRYGDPGGNISQLATIDKYDLIVMGIRDKLNFIARLTGNTATHVMNHSDVPVLLIHSNTRFALPKKIVFAFDKKKDLDDGVEAFKLLNTHINASTDFIHILSDTEVNVTDLSEEIIEELFEGDEPSFSFQIKTIKEKDPIPAIYDYCLFEKADMLAMLHRKDGALDLLLNRSYSIKAAYSFHLPVLVIPE